MFLFWSIAALAAATVFFRVLRATRKAKLDLPYVQFDGDNSDARYKEDSLSLLTRGYKEYISKDRAFAIRDPTEVEQPMAVLPVKYLDEVKWLPEQKMSFWTHIDKLSALSQIGGPRLNEEVSIAARHGLNVALAHLIEPLEKACLAAYAKELPPCADWTSIHPCPLIVKIFASISALIMVGPELGAPDSDWQALSTAYLQVAMTGPREVRDYYPPWLYRLAPYTNKNIREMWRLRARGAALLAPLLEERRAASEEAAVHAEKGGKVREGKRKYEDAVQWLYDAHKTTGRPLTPDQLVQEVLVIMVASLHSTSAVGLSVLFDMLDHPEAVEDIRGEIVRVRKANPMWTRPALAELKLLDSFMRESARIHGLTQYTAVQRVAMVPWTFKDGLTIPTGTTLVFPGYHHGTDPSVHPDPEKFDFKRHLRKREEKDENAHKFHFASAGSEDIISWGAGEHACPGRFFAQEGLKLMFIHLLTHYDFKYAESTKEMPRFVARNLFLSPNPMLPIMIRERKVDG
ncbi:cytochrome P450 [Coniochaeta sp. 2T2.1]|nr:cytochrome P450 [Coniochaeta sp. 2T2.1]